MATSKQFGPYTLVRKLGTGGMAVTFEAVRRGPGGFAQRVCLKRILSAFESDAEFVRLFLEEARIAAALRHNNIVQVLDFGVADKSHFLALELIEGLDLRALLRALRSRGEQLSAEFVTLIGIELATALDAAHQPDAHGQAQGVIHRDVSPANVLLSVAGEVKLTDFGIAKAMSSPRITRSGVVKGKVPYMAPEYALNGQCNVRTDLFSLGVTLYEALAGERPFQGDNDLEVLNAARSGRFKPLSVTRPDAPDALVTTIERLLALAPEARWVHAAAVVEALATVAGPPTSRRALGTLVSEVAATLPAIEGLDEAPDAQPVGPQTLQLNAVAEGATPSDQVLASEAAEETRTRIPSQAPPVSVPGARHSNTWRGATPDPVSEAPAGSHLSSRPPERPVRKAQSFPAPPRAKSPSSTTSREMIPSAENASNAMASEPAPERPSRTTRRGFGTASNMASTDDLERTPSRRKGSLAAVVVVLALAAGGAFVAMRSEAPADSIAPSGNAVADAEHKAPEQAQVQVAEDSVPATVADTTPSEATDVPGVALRVVAVPYGQVWIDGEKRGQSPLTLSDLSAGEHEIAVGRTKPTLRRTVELPPAPGPTVQQVLGPLN